MPDAGWEEDDVLTGQRTDLENKYLTEDPMLKENSVPDVMSLTCARCGRTFTPTGTRGPVPLYCSQSCRQRAYERRWGRSVAEQRSERLCQYGGCRKPATVDIREWQPTHGRGWVIVSYCAHHAASAPGNPLPAEGDDERTDNPKEFVHQCITPGCGTLVEYDDEPCCFKHSPDSGSHLPFYSARERLTEGINPPQ